MCTGYGNSSNSILKHLYIEACLLYKSTTMTRIDWLLADLRFMLRARRSYSRCYVCCCGKGDGFASQASRNQVPLNVIF